MDDNKIIELYWARLEDAIRETSVKYGKLCRFIAENILSSREDSEECVNDTYLGLWNAIPPERPNRFSVFVSRVARNQALKKYEYLSAAKRNPEADHKYMAHALVCVCHNALLYEGAATAWLSR